MSAAITTLISINCPSWGKNISTTKVFDQIHYSQVPDTKSNNPCRETFHLRWDLIARSSDSSFVSASSKISFRKFLRRMSSKRRNPMDSSTIELHREARKSANKTMSIRFGEWVASITISCNNSEPLISTEIATMKWMKFQINLWMNVTSKTFRSAVTKQMMTEALVSWLDQNLFHYTNVYQMIRDVHTHVEQLAIEILQIAFNNLHIHSTSSCYLRHRPWRQRSCTASIKVWRGEEIWHNSSSYLFSVFESVRHSNFSRFLYEHFHVANFKSHYRRLASKLDRQRCYCCCWCMYAI